MKQRQCPRCPTGSTYKELCPLCYRPTVDLTVYTDAKFIEKQESKIVELLTEIRDLLVSGVTNEPRGSKEGLYVRTETVKIADG